MVHSQLMSSSTRALKVTFAKSTILIYILQIAALSLIDDQTVKCAQVNQFNQEQQQQHHQQPLIDVLPHKTADLTLLINETLAINNKTIESGKQSVKDDWTFDMVEYDLMEFLKDLSARYQSSGSSGSVSSRPAANDEEPLEAKSGSTSASTPTTTSPPVSSTSSGSSISSSVGETDKTININTNSSPTSTGANSTGPVGQQSDSNATTTTRSPNRIVHPTVVPEISTSLASGDHELSESSWQYGIFDRFTRPRSTSTTTREPSEVSKNIEVRDFNSDECGLRTYVDYQLPQHFDSEATKELNQRRHRLPPSEITPLLEGHRRIIHQQQQQQQQQPGSSLVDDTNDQQEIAERDRIRNKDRIETNEKEAYESFKQNSAPNSSNDPFDNEFNLSSRRHWLQQQLGNTLQMLGYNMSASTQSAPDFWNQTASHSLNLRENMMKKSGKFGKSSSILSQPSIEEQELYARQDEFKLQARVIGGSDARLGDSPWSVSLQALVSRPGTNGVEYRHYCGGTIISEYYVLTAAHCLDFMVGRESRLFVVIGDLNWRISPASQYGRRFGIEKLIIHSGYKSTAFGHDIGLIRTKESMRALKVNGKYIINSVCLPERGVEHSGEAELVGWGLFSNRNEMADSLQIADVPILPRGLCVDLYRRRTGLIQWLIGIELITEKQICAGTFGRGICQGDSGSALVFNDREPIKPTGRTMSRASESQSRATIIGVVAFGGIRRCSYQSLPGVYMQTSKYMDWILPRVHA